MKDLMLLFAEVLPQEEIVKMLKEALEEYESVPTDENYKKLAMPCMLLVSKQATSQHKDGAVGVIKETDKMKQGFDLLNTKVG